MTDRLFSLSEIMSCVFWNILTSITCVAGERRLPEDAETTLAWRNDGRVFLKQKRDAAYDDETVSYSTTLPAF